MSYSNRAEAILVMLTVVGVIASSLVLVGGMNSSRAAIAKPPAAARLPPGCSKPAGGYLIVMSRYGYNDSVLEGAGPTKAWPVISVAQNTTVNITVCNADSVEAHGFQISNYFDSEIVAVIPGQVIHVSFVATKAGTFRIYCAIFCTIHLFMEYGQLQVTS